MLLFYIGPKAKSMEIYPRELLKSNWPYRDAFSVWKELGETTFSSSSYVSYKGTIRIICQDEGTYMFPREIENNSLCKLWGANKVYYGR